MNTKYFDEQLQILRDLLDEESDTEREIIELEQRLDAKRREIAAIRVAARGWVTAACAMGHIDESDRDEAETYLEQYDIL